MIQGTILIYMCDLSPLEKGKLTLNEIVWRVWLASIRDGKMAVTTGQWFPFNFHGHHDIVCNI